MASSAPKSPLRQLIEDRLSQLTADVEAVIQDACRRARRESAEQLNQAARRLRQEENTEDLAATLADVAAPFSSGVAVFRIDGEAAEGVRIRGVGEEAADRFRSLRIPLASAAALAGAVETRDPVTAAATASELSAEMVELAGHTPEGRVSIIPVAAGERVAALLYAWGEVQIAPAELLAQVAAGVWAGMEAAAAAKPVAAAELVQIAAAAAAEEAPARQKSWDELSPAEQQTHLKAQRFARVRVAEMRLHQAPAVQAGRSRRDVYASLRPAIDAARQEFQETFFAACPSMVDYLHLELVRTLANDDGELLGKDYPGPMV